MKKFLCFSILILLALSSCKKSENMDLTKDTVTKLSSPAQLTGIWQGELNTHEPGSYNFSMDIYVKHKTKKVLLTIEQIGLYFMPVDWKIKKGQLIFSIDIGNRKEDFALSMSDEKSLKGTLTEFDKTNEITFTKISDKAINGKYFIKYPEYSYEERYQQLKEYSEYAEDNTTIPYTYELNLREKYKDLIDTYDLDKVTKGYDDVDLMIQLLNWVCNNFKHNGNSGLPNKHNAYTITDFCKKHSDQVNCRGLSIILAEVLRLYGIPAKHITCMPKEVLFNDCHVVVHAYSEELGQWIMLDPTYRLILKNENGDYVNLPMLRKILINGQKLIPNKNAGRNGAVFDLEDYREYMTKNTLRFQCATNFGFGSEDGVDGDVANMLVPLNYNEDKGERTTTSEEAFWVLP